MSMEMFSMESLLLNRWFSFNLFAHFCFSRAGLHIRNSTFYLHFDTGMFRLEKISSLFTMLTRFAVGTSALCGSHYQKRIALFYFYHCNFSWKRIDLIAVNLFSMCIVHDKINPLNNNKKNQVKIVSINSRNSSRFSQFQHQQITPL